MKNILTIAGYDPSSGAGVTRDLDTFFSLGCHGLSVPTCFVVQGPQGVRDIQPIPLDQFASMLRVVEEEVAVDGVKIGVVWDSPYIEMISSFLKKLKGKPVVVDPIYAAKNGRKLITEEGLNCLVKKIFPLTTLLTPNLGEASLLTGKKIKTLDEAKSCAKELIRLGPRAVVVKGGHLKGAPVDVFFDGQDIFVWEKPRINRQVHGTGCLFSSLLAAFLTNGYALEEAFLAAEKEMEQALEKNYFIATSNGYSYSSPTLIKASLAERWQVVGSLRQAAEKLLELNPVELIPEVQMNIGYALPQAERVEEVAAFPGRISQSRGKILFKGEPQFGASSHVARLILAMMKHFPQLRACANLRYVQAYVEMARKNNFKVVFFDRRKEPPRLKQAEGKSLDFLMESILKKMDQPPDFIYDRGDVGKEPIIRCFARDPLELLEKIEKIRL